MILQHALQHGAQVGGRLQVAAVVAGWRPSGPASRRSRGRLHAPPASSATRAGAVVGAFGAVDARGAAEFGDDRDRRCCASAGQAPARTPRTRRRARRAVAPAGRSAPPSLAWVSQPSKASAAMRGPSSAAISFAAPRAASRMAPAPSCRAACCRRLRGLVELQAVRQRLRQRRIALAVEIRAAASRCPRRPAAARPAPSRPSARHRAGSAARSGRPQARR